MNYKILAASILSIAMVGGMNAAFAQGTPEQEAELDRLLNEWYSLYERQQDIMENPPVKKSANQLANVNATMDRIWSQYEQLEDQIPRPELADISPEMEQRMESIMDRLGSSEFPIVTMGINYYTGHLKIGIDKDRSKNIDTQIIRFVNDSSVTLDIGYQKNQGTLQASVCDKRTKVCNPVIAGSVGEDRVDGRDCTIGVVDDKRVGRSNIDGIVLPKHCVTSPFVQGTNNSFFQSDNDRASDLVGPIHTNAISNNCDCVFISAPTRDVSDTKIFRLDRSSDISSSGKTSLSIGDRVWVCLVVNQESKLLQLSLLTNV